MNSTELETKSPLNKPKEKVYTEIGNQSLVLEDILEDSDNVKLLDINTNKAITLLTIENIKKMIDYSTKMPLDDSVTLGFKYPYNATQLLCSSNIRIQKLLIHEEDIEVLGLETPEEKKDESLVKNKIRYDVVDYLFSFFNQDLNDQYAVLIGYFAKIFQAILNLLGNKLIAYLFTETPEAINQLILNMHFRGIADCLEKILTYQSYDTPSESSSIYQQQLYEMILTQMLHQNEDQIESICETLKYCLLNSSLHQLMISSKTSIDTLFRVLKNSIIYPSNYKHILSVLIALIDKSKELFSKQITSNPTKQSNRNYYDANESSSEIEIKVNIDQLLPLMSKINETIPDIIINLSSHTINYFTISNVYTLKSLGMIKVIESEYIKSALELAITALANSQFEEIGIQFIEKLIQQKGLMVLTYYYFEYPNNNIFAYVYKDILSVTMNEFAPPQLIKHVLLESGLITRTIESLINEKKKIHFRSKTYTNNCIFANGISILDLISKTKNEAVFSLLKENTDYLAFNDILMSNILKLFNQKLCFSESTEIIDYVDFMNPSKDLSQIHLQWFSLEELFEVNLMIYSAYQQGGDYKKLIEILKKEMAPDEIDANKSYCVTERLADSNNDESFSSNPFMLNDNSDESSSLSQEPDESSYYDNNFWQSRDYSSLDNSYLSDISDLL